MKYIVNFTKKDRMVYISHLDLQRMLLRVLRMTNLKPAYTHGFHPHAKLSIALPLSLGYASEDEYFEFETNGSIDTDAAAGTLNDALPDGISVKRVCARPDALVGSLAALTTSVTYEIMTFYDRGNEQSEGGALDGEMMSSAVSRWLGGENIEIEKFNKKKQRAEKFDVKNRILSFSPVKQWGNKIIFELTLRAEGGNVPNPLTIFTGFLRFSGTETALNVLSVTRTRIEIPGI
jgi:radical SAM-linked protein